MFLCLNLTCLGVPRHLQPSFLFQREEGGVDAETVCTAVLEDGIDGGTVLVLLEVREGEEGVAVLVINVRYYLKFKYHLYKRETPSSISTL